MSYENKRKEFAKEHINIVEIDLDQCSLTYGSAPCTAAHFSMALTSVTGTFRVGDVITGATTALEGVVLAIEGTGASVTLFYYPTGTNFSTTAETINSNSGASGSKSTTAPSSATKFKCFNTRATCQDLANYNGDTQTPKTYRFCSARSPQPIGLDAIPSLMNEPSLSPTKIDVAGGLGFRASASMSFGDHPHSDIDIDPYLSERDYDPLEQGTFWTKLRARNFGYEDREVRVLSGYLNDDGTYDVSNFDIRKYVLDDISVGQGKASVKAKDPLKLVMKEKAQAPEKSEGKLASAITGTPSTFSVATGQGASYPTSGKVCIDNEIISYGGRTGDVFDTLTRAENNTVSADHSVDANVQLVYEKNDFVENIVNDLLVNFAGVPSTFIPLSSWATERAKTIDYQLDGIIPKPTDVNKLLKELAESAPHYLYWDESSNTIQFVALDAPEQGAVVLDEDIVLEDSLRNKEKPDMRYSTVIVNFNQFNPTEKLDEPSNYRQAVVRIDSDSLAEYKNNKIKTVFSRWMTNEAFANNIAALIGRRFAYVPREVSFGVDPKDADFWAGDQRYIRHRDMPDFYGNPDTVLYQMISVKEMANKFAYTGLEFRYGQALVNDVTSGIQTYIVPPEAREIDLYDIYETNFGVPSGDVEVQFIINKDGSNGTGANSTSAYAIDTGSDILAEWGNAGVTSLSITLIIQSGGLVFGKGGAGGSNGVGGAGGDAIFADVPITITVDGTLGGGGGGGGGSDENDLGSTGGGGGAGLGAKGTALNDPTATITQQPVDGTASLGGVGARIEDNSDPLSFIVGGKGGDLGSAGASGGTSSGGGTTYSGGAAGDAIVVGSNIVAGDVTLNGSGDVFGGLNGVVDGTT